MKLIHIMPGLILMAFTFCLDQYSKWYMLDIVHLSDGPPIEITPFFNLTMVWNRGVSFGMFAGANQPSILIALSMLIMVTLFSWLLKTPSRPTVYALGAIIGGAAGNIVDRCRFGSVVDFLDFHLGRLHWPAFNIADSSIFIGVVVLLAISMFMGRDNPKGHH
jgi:signal peptidase II